MPSTLAHERAVRLLIADDHRLFAESLMTVLSEDDRIEVVGIAGDGGEAVALAAQLRPDVILMDVRMPVLDGLEATRRIRATGLPTQILILTGPDTPVNLEDATRAGASGFLRKERSLEELRHIFLEVASLAVALGASSN
jgi:DNA-binding NarL/FixJ family response regulator